MSQASEEYINQQEIEQITGSITALPSPMSLAQYDYIIELMEDSILADVQKKEINRLLQEGNLTMDHATRIITALLEQQVNPLDKVKNGELLKQCDLKKAIRKAVDDPNS